MTELIDFVFQHVDSYKDSNIYKEGNDSFNYNINILNINLSISINISYHKHESYIEQPFFSKEQMHQIFNYVIAEMKQIEINTIRNDINDIVITTSSILKNNNFFKRLHHSIIKYGYEFEIYVIINTM